MPYRRPHARLSRLSDQVATAGAGPATRGDDIFKTAWTARSGLLEDHLDPFSAAV